MFSEFATTTLREDLELERLTKAKAVNGVITVGVFSDLHGLAEAADFAVLHSQVQASYE